MLDMTIDQVYSLVEDIVLEKSPQEAKTIKIRSYYKFSEIFRRNKTVLIELPNLETYLISPEGKTERLV